MVQIVMSVPGYHIDKVMGAYKQWADSALEFIAWCLPADRICGRISHSLAARVGVQC